MNKQRGFSAVEIILVIVIVGLLGAVGWLFLQNSEQNKTNNAASVKTTPTPTPKPDEIIKQAGKMNLYKNYELGFQFAFPKQIQGWVGCKLADDAPKRYLGVSDVQDMNVFKSGNEYHIASTRPIVFINAEVNGQSINSGCSGPKDTNLALIQQYEAQNYTSKTNISLDQLVFKVYKLEKESDIAVKLADIYSYVGSGIGYTLKKDTDQPNRKVVTMAVKNPSTAYGGGRLVTWYLPDAKLLATINLGNGIQFIDANNTEKYYDEDVANSFRLINS